MNITIESDAKEIAALLELTAPLERLIDSRIEEKLNEESRRLAQSFERFTPSKEFLLEFQKTVTE